MGRQSEVSSDTLYATKGHGPHLEGLDGHHQLVEVDVAGVIEKLRVLRLAVLMGLCCAN